MWKWWYLGSCGYCFMGSWLWRKRCSRSLCQSFTISRLDSRTTFKKSVTRLWLFNALNHIHLFIFVFIIKKNVLPWLWCFALQPIKICTLLRNYDCCLLSSTIHVIHIVLIEIYHINQTNSIIKSIVLVYIFNCSRNTMSFRSTFIKFGAI